jgi:predicted nucleic acid-binding protein
VSGGTAQPTPHPRRKPIRIPSDTSGGVWEGATSIYINHPLQPEDLAQALYDAETFEIVIEATQWADVHRAWELAEGSLRYADAIYVAAAERHASALLTADSRIERSGASIACEIITV